MTSGDEKQERGEGKGFAGLASLVSDVDTPPPPVAKVESAAPGEGRSALQSPQPTQRQTRQEPAQPPSFDVSAVKWVLGIAAVIGVFVLSGLLDRHLRPSAPAYSPSPETAEANDSLSPQISLPIYLPPIELEAPSRPQESMPSIGQGLVLSTNEIRYCLAEDIRLEGAKFAVNNYIESDVNRFNAMVDDYNSRCGSFRYRSGALESARRDVEPYRSELLTEGRLRFGRPSTG